MKKNKRTTPVCISLRLSGPDEMQTPPGGPVAFCELCFEKSGENEFRLHGKIVFDHKKLTEEAIRKFEWLDPELF